MTRPSFQRLSAASQRGATLLVAMIFLVVLMLIVASAVKVTNVNTQVVGNMQTEKEAVAAAQQAIEQVIGDAFLASDLPVSQTVKVDINNSGKSGSLYVVDVVRSCIATTAPVSCDSGAATGSHIDDGGTPPSSDTCTVWNIEAKATPSNSTQPAAVLNQGVAVQSPSDEC